MHRAPLSSWQIALDSPEWLQFASYVARREGVAIPPSGGADSPFAAEWRTWWITLEESATQDWADLVAIYDPPAFASLASMPLLMHAYQRHWHEFKRQWDQAKPITVQRIMVCLRTLDLQGIVRACQRSARRPVRPFALRLDFVDWPEMVEWQPSAGHLVLGIRYLEPARIKDLSVLIQTAVAALL